MSSLCCEKGFSNLSLLFSVYLLPPCVSALPRVNGGVVTGAGAISTVAVPERGKRVVVPQGFHSPDS